jgi:hypothetical protein
MERKDHRAMLVLSENIVCVPASHASYPLPFCYTILAECQSHPISSVNNNLGFKRYILIICIHSCTIELRAPHLHGSIGGILNI